MSQCVRFLKKFWKNFAMYWILLCIGFVELHCIWLFQFHFCFRLFSWFSCCFQDFFIVTLMYFWDKILTQVFLLTRQWPFCNFVNYLMSFVVCSLLAHDTTLMSSHRMSCWHSSVYLFLSEYFWWVEWNATTFSESISSLRLTSCKCKVTMLARLFLSVNLSISVLQVYFWYPLRLLFRIFGLIVVACSAYVVVRLCSCF